MSLSDDIKAFRDKALLAASKNTNNIVEELFTQAVIRSPSPTNPGRFAKGLLVNQWYSSIGSTYSLSVTSATNAYGIDSLSRIKATIAENPFLGKDNEVTLANNTQEAYHAEVLGWPAGGGANGWVWSGRQGPYAMVRGAITYIQGKYQ